MYFCSLLGRSLCNMNMLSQSQLRNTMHKEDHEPEYLLCAKLHDDDFDDRGYVTSIWTSVTMLQTLQEPQAALERFQTDAQTAIDAAFGDGRS